MLKLRLPSGYGSCMLTAVTALQSCRHDMRRKYRFIYVLNCCFKFCVEQKNHLPSAVSWWGHFAGRTCGTNDSNVYFVLDT